MRPEINVSEKVELMEMFQKPLSTKTYNTRRPKHGPQVVTHTRYSKTERTHSRYGNKYPRGSQSRTTGGLEAWNRETVETLRRNRPVP